MISEKKVVFIIIAALILVSLIGMTLAGFGLSGISPHSSLGFEIILAICGMVLLFGFLLISCYTCLSEFMLDTKVEVSRIKIPKMVSQSSVRIVDLV